METEKQKQPKKSLRQCAAVSEPEPSITLSIAHPNFNNPRRQASSFKEPRVLDFSEFDPLEGRTPPYEMTTPTASSKPYGMTDPTSNSDFPNNREGGYSCFRTRYEMSNDVTVKMMTVSPKFLRVLRSVNNSADHRRRGAPNVHDCRDEGVDADSGDEWGVKITEMRSPSREEHPPRSSFNLETMPGSPAVSAQAVRQKAFAQKAPDVSLPRPVKETEADDEKRDSVIWSASSSGLKSVPDKHYDVSGGMQEKSSSNQAKSKSAPAVEGRDAGSDEERTSKVSLDDALLSRNALDSSLRVKTRLSEQSLSLNEPLNKESSAEPWMDARVAAPSAKKRESGSSFEKEDEDEDEDEGEEDESPVYFRETSTWSRLPGNNQQGRKRRLVVEEGQGIWPAKLKDDDLVGNGTVRRSLRPQGTPSPDFVELDDDSDDGLPLGKHRTKEGSSHWKLDRNRGSLTIAALMRLKGIAMEDGDMAAPGFRPRQRKHGREKKHRRDDPFDGSLLDEENEDETAVPDPDIFNFDLDRTETVVKPHQVWAVYSESDQMPRSYARIDAVFTQPKFQATVTYLKPHQPSEEMTRLSQLSGHSISCGQFESGEQISLNKINCFSHKMVVGLVSTDMVKIYPRKGEIWALYKKRDRENLTPGTSKARFSVAEITKNVEPGEMPLIVVLGRVSGFSTIWSPAYSEGALPDPGLLLFSHRVPAYSVHGHVLKGKHMGKGFWDIDPAGLPLGDA